MNDCHVVAFLLKRVDCNDGITSHCETLMRGLIKSGWKVILITGKIGYDESSKRRFESLKALAAEWIVIDKFDQTLASFGNLGRICQIIKQYKIELLHVHGYAMLGLASALRLLTGVNCVSTFHLLKPIHYEKHQDLKLRLKKLLLKFYLRIFAPKIFIAIASDIETWLIDDIGIAPAKIRKVFNGIDTNYFHPPSAEEKQEARHKFHLTEQDFVISLVGRTQWDKGHRLLIDAVRQTAVSQPDYAFRCLFAGSGDQTEEIKSYAFNESASHSIFNFLGYIQDTRSVYWASDVIVLPSLAEGFGLVIVEALTCGVVAIRTPTAGTFDQIEEGVNGFIIPFDGRDALADYLARLAGDRELRSRMQAGALKLSNQKFTLEAMTLGTIAAYESSL